MLVFGGENKEVPILGHFAVRAVSLKHLMRAGRKLGSLVKSGDIFSRFHIRVAGGDVQSLVTKR